MTYIKVYKDMSYNVEEQPLEDKWEITVDGLVRNPKLVSENELKSLPKKEIEAEIICLQGKILTGNWQGALLADLLRETEPLENAKFIQVSSYGGFKETLSVEESSEIYLAYDYENNPIEKEHGGPYRLLAPSKYAYKNIKWVKELKLVDKPLPGYWEKKGYPNKDEPEKT